MEGPAAVRGRRPPPAGHRHPAAVGEVEGFLREHRVTTYVHRPQGDRRRDEERFTERLRTVGALVVCHGEVEATRVGSRLDQAVNAVFKTACPLDFFCVYVAPPEKDLRPYERFQWLRDKFALLPNPTGPLEARTFAPLFEKLGVVGSTA